MFHIISFTEDRFILANSVECTVAPEADYDKYFCHTKMLIEFVQFSNL